MNRDRLEQLLWERIDGTISPEDLAELEAYLVEHPEPRELERDIGKLAELLDNPDEVVPPAELRGRIKRSLETASPTWSHRRPSARTVSTPGFERRLPRWIPVAASLVIGVAIGYLLHTVPASQIGSSEVAGSMTGPEIHASRAHVVDLGPGTGSIEVRRSGEVLTLDLDLTEDAEIELIVEHSNGRSTTIGNAGARTRRLVLENPGPVRLEVRSGGVMVAEHTIEADDSETHQ